MSKVQSCSIAEGLARNAYLQAYSIRFVARLILKREIRRSVAVEDYEGAAHYRQAMIVLSNIKSGIFA